jgi:hypothetical protein|nr:DUF1272 domain-containing protein [uncultured Psychroserpens sp.]
MLQIRPTCEHCNTNLPYDSKEAMICTFECTFCKDCVALLKEVCPNCGGDFTDRPIRPKHHLDKHPASEKVVFKPVDLEKHYKNLENK